MTRFPSKQKAIDCAMWQNCNHRFKDKPYGMVLSTLGDYLVVPKNHPTFKGEDFETLPKDYSKMDYKHIQQIAMDEDPLSHFEEIRGMFSTAHGELLRMILKKTTAKEIYSL